MHIAGLRKRITFQKNTLVVDANKNHRNEWKDHYSCRATASKTGGSETTDAVTTEKEVIDFTVRACSELAGASSDRFRIVCDGRVYNIIYVDPMGYKGNSLKFHCETERRRE